MDTLSQQERSVRMSRVRSRDTRPELRVRSLLHSLGYRFRLRGVDVPGHPDIVFKGREKAILVHGCFWHRHQGCARTRTPKSRVEFWESKFRRNMERDQEVREALTRAGWDTLTIWECESEKPQELEPRLKDFLGATRAIA